jgi:hypothetical protein
MGLDPIFQKLWYLCKNEYSLSITGRNLNVETGTFILLLQRLGENILTVGNDIPNLAYPDRPMRG